MFTGCFTETITYRAKVYKVFHRDYHTQNKGLRGVSLRLSHTEQRFTGCFTETITYRANVYRVFHRDYHIQSKGLQGVSQRLSHTEQRFTGCFTETITHRTKVYGVFHCVVLLYDLECSFMVKGVQPSICSCHTHD